MDSLKECLHLWGLCLTHTFHTLTNSHIPYINCRLFHHHFWAVYIYYSCPSKWSCLCIRVFQNATNSLIKASFFPFVALDELRPNKKKCRVSTNSIDPVFWGIWGFFFFFFFIFFFCGFFFFCFCFKFFFLKKNFFFKKKKKFFFCFLLNKKKKQKKY